jgi:DNA repair protein RadD
MELRPNQVKPVQIGIDFFKQTNPSPSIIVAPTAFGKSIAIAKIAEKVEGNLLILQPSKELLEQNFNKFLMIGGNASIYSASFNSKKISSVTYATIGSIQQIGKLFKDKGFTKMIIDECHLYPRNMDSMIGRFLQDSGITHVLGLTATPLKLQSNTDLNGNVFSKLQMLTSKSKKGNFYKDIIYVCQVSEMVELGFWSKLEYEQFDFDESKLVYNSTKADFTEESLLAIYNSNDFHGNILNKIKMMPDRKSIIVFVPSVANAIELANKIPDSVAIYGDMPKAERNNAVKLFKSGKIRVVVNVNVLSVGFDHPELDCIICARPTASLAWYYQALGRGTRISKYKKDCLIVDFSGNVKRFGKVECLQITKEKNTWKMYGEGGKLLTGIPLHEVGHHLIVPELPPLPNGEQPKVIMPFGKFKDKEIKDIDKNYRTWMLTNFDWNHRNKHIKDEIIRISMIESESLEEVKIA